MKNSKNLFIGLVLLVVVAAGVSYLLVRKASLNGNNTAAVNQITPSQDLVLLPDSELPRLIINPQFPGNLVFVSAVSLPLGGWVVIHKVKNGQADKIIGVGYFGSNVSAGEVLLSEETSEGGEYVATLRRDNGDESFNVADDKPFVDVAGRIITVPFEITQNLPEEKG